MRRLRLELQRARADNAALLSRLVAERHGAQTRLECTVAHWSQKLQQSESFRMAIANETRHDD